MEPFLFNSDDETGKPRRNRNLFCGTDLLVFDIDESMTLAEAWPCYSAKSRIIQLKDAEDEWDRVGDETIEPVDDKKVQNS